VTQRLAYVPSGAVLAEGYSPGLAPATQGALCRPGQAPVPGPEYVKPFEFDPKHCHYAQEDEDGVMSQCGSWPVKKVDNPDMYCSGHLKMKAANGAHAEPDQDVHSNAP
jgi:hypothetical protein